MRRKLTILLLVFVLICSISIKTTYAANEASIDLKPNSTNLKQGDELTLKVSINNVAVEEGIVDALGYLKYDAEIFKMKVLTEDELEEKLVEQIDKIMQNETLVEILDYINEVLFIDEKWLIAEIEDEDEDVCLVAIICLDENNGIRKGLTNEIGEIKFNVLNSANNGTTKIELTDIEITSEGSLVNDATTPNIIIEGTQSTPVEDESAEEDLEEKEEENKEDNQYYKEEDVKEDSTQAKQDIVYAGTKEIIPAIFIILIISILSYVRLRKYKKI